jgi:hypothetical protein
MVQLLQFAVYQANYLSDKSILEKFVLLNLHTV